MSTDDAVPFVEGPLAGGDHGWPFASPPDDVAEHGYLLEEFILSGTATSYRSAGGGTPTDGRWDTRADDEAAFVTRAYVVRPSDASRFNGVVVVNWQNVTAGFDLGSPSGSEIFRGYAWVGVTTQKIGVDGIAGRTKGLRAWDPTRYGTLSHPGDAHSYDMFSQAGRLARGIKDPRGRGILGGLQPKTVIATGGSQSAMRLGSYLNATHQHVRVFDGFHLTVHWGICPPLEELELTEMFPTDAQPMSPALCQIRDDCDVPIMIVATECEARFNLPVRQPDTATFRFWEIASAAHQSPSAVAASARMMARDGMTRLPPEPDRNTVEWRYVNEAALRALVTWVEQGNPPSSQPRLEAVSVEPPELARDAFGNTIGGIRVPEVAAPVAAFRGERDGGLANPAWLQGHSEPFSEAQLKKRYATATARRDTWNEAVDRLAAEGLVLPEDVETLRARGSEG